MFDPPLAGFVSWLAQRPYAPRTRGKYARVVGDFLRFLADSCDALEAMRPDHAREYLDARARTHPPSGPPTDRPPVQNDATKALRRFADFLAERGVHVPIPRYRPIRGPRSGSLRPARDLCAVPGFAPLLADYARFLRDHRGFAESTVHSYLDYVGRLCRALGAAGTTAWDAVAPALLYAHLHNQARTLGIACLRKTQSAWRDFFRFLRLTGRATRDLTGLLVRFQTYSQASLPRTVTEADLRRLFDDVAGSSPAQIRDRAVLVLLAAYGLRTGEAVRLTLDDLHWRGGRFLVRGRKNGRDLVLPLLPPVARALADYLQRARPPGTPFRQVFLATFPPHPYARGSDLGKVLHRRLARLGLDFPPHALRHTLASRLINGDCPPEWIRILLGHASIDSTRIYAKIDLAHLREVAAIGEFPL